MKRLLYKGNVILFEFSINGTSSALGERKSLVMTDHELPITNDQD